MTTSPTVSSVGRKASSEAFVFLRVFNMPDTIIKQKAVVYVDGFNLYYGSLKGTAYKWLDLKSLFNKLLGTHHIVTEIKYFTARISPRDNDLEPPQHQKVYLTALEKYIPELTIYYGHYLTNIVTAKVHQPKNSHPKYVKIIKTEE